MKRRKFQEEEVVEETTTTEESTPDSHQQFVTLLTEMGLSAEQAEAIHQMAMDLIEGSPQDAGSEQKVEASRMRRRSYGRGGRRRGMATGRRRGMGHGPARRRGMSRLERQQPRGRRHMSRHNDTDRMRRQLSRQRREIAQLREQLKQFGAQPGAGRMHNAPAPAQNHTAPSVPQGGTIKDRVFKMLEGTF